MGVAWFDLECFVGKAVLVITVDGRVFVGILKTFDQLVNVVLTDVEERIFESSEGIKQIHLGVQFIRGDSIATIGDVDERIESMSAIQAKPLESFVTN